MHKQLRGLVLILAAAAVASASEVSGVLMDRNCAADALKKDPQQNALKHERQCALMDECVKSGYGVVTSDDKFLKFDDAGNTKMVALLKASEKKDNLRIKVTGDVSGDQITVQSVELQ